MKTRLLRNSYNVCALQILRKTYRYGQHKTISTQALPENVKPFTSIPGLSSLPIIGSLHHFLPVIGEIGPDGQLFQHFERFEAKFGPVMQMKGVFARGHFVILFEPEHFEQVYKAEEVNPLRPGFQALTYYRQVMKKSTYKGVYGLITSDGAEWRDFRTKVNPALLKPKLIKLYTPGLEEIAEEMVARISKLNDQPQFLQENLELELTKWSLESVAFIGLGARLQCMEEGLTEDHPSRKLIKCAKDIMDLSFKLEFIPSPWRYITTPTFRKIVNVFEMQWDVSTIYVNEAKQKIKSRGHDIPEENKSIIEKLLAIDETVAIMMAYDMLLAGIDTVTFTAMSLLYHLAANPNTQDKLRQEIRSNNSNRYLRACMKESLRIWHVVPANLRRTSREHVVGGYQIPAGVDVIAPNQYLSNSEKYYTRAKEFLPERWLADKNDPLYHGNAHPMVSLPFGYGVRSCIGRRIAELEIETLVKKILKEFELKWEGPPLKIKTLLLNSIEKPFYIRFERINSP